MKGWPGIAVAGVKLYGNAASGSIPDGGFGLVTSHLSLVIGGRTFNGRVGMAKQMKDMTEPELHEHLSFQLRFIRSQQTPDTIGSMLVIFQEDGITQYGATVEPETVPQALRELADRIEQRETVKRGGG